MLRREKISSICIEASSLNADTLPFYECHIHTHYSKGENTIEEIVQSALKLGIKKIAFTEHTESWLSKKKNWFKDYLNDIKKAQKKFNDTITIHAGIEAPAIDFNGGLEGGHEIVEAVDFVLGAAHRYPGIDGIRVKDLSAEEAVELEYKTLMALAENPSVDSIAHIGATCSKYVAEFPIKYIREVIKRAASNGTAIEINSCYHNKIIDVILGICKEYRSLLTFGSNAYCVEDLGKSYMMLKAALRKGKNGF